jgi:hypothetical protein
MTTDGATIQQGSVSEGTESTTTDQKSAVVVDKPSGQTLTKEDVAKLIQEQMSQLKSQFEEEKKGLKGAIQSAKDRAIQEVRRAKEADIEKMAVIEAARKTDPELAEKLDHQRLKAKEELRQKESQDVESEGKLEEFNKDFRSRIQKALKKLGVDPEDPKIIWGESSEHPLERLEKILDSATAVSLEGQKKTSETDIEARIAKAVKEAEEKVRRELGFDSVDTKSSKGAGTDSDFILAYSKENSTLNSPADHARARKILKL